MIYMFVCELRYESAVSSVTVPQSSAFFLAVIIAYLTFAHKIAHGFHERRDKTTPERRGKDSENYVRYDM